MQIWELLKKLILTQLLYQWAQCSLGKIQALPGDKALPISPPPLPICHPAFFGFLASSAPQQLQLCQQDLSLQSTPQPHHQSHYPSHPPVPPWPHALVPQSQYWCWHHHGRHDAALPVCTDFEWLTEPHYWGWGQSWCCWVWWQGRMGTQCCWGCPNHKSIKGPLCSDGIFMVASTAFRLVCHNWACHISGACFSWSIGQKLFTGSLKSHYTPVLPSSP